MSHLPDVRPLLLPLLISLAACGSPDRNETVEEDALEELEDTLAEDTTANRSGGDAAGPDTAAPATGPPAGDPSAGGAPTGDVPPGGDDRARTPTGELEPPEWTVERVTVEPGVAGVAEIRHFRHARHDGHDRIVFEFAGAEAPGYSVEYIDRPLHECGSGRQIHPVGDAWLEIRLEPARGYTEQGESTLPASPGAGGLTRVQEIYRTCNFEGHVDLVLAVDAPVPFRAFDVAEPTRVVVDISHGSG